MWVYKGSELGAHTRERGSTRKYGVSTFPRELGPSHIARCTRANIGSFEYWKLERSIPQMGSICISKESNQALTKAPQLAGYSEKRWGRERRALQGRELSIIVGS